LLSQCRARATYSNSKLGGEEDSPGICGGGSRDLLTKRVRPYKQWVDLDLPRRSLLMILVRSEPRSLGEATNELRSEKEDDNHDSHSRAYPQMTKGKKHE
jgi:hypothetical protein